MAGQRKEERMLFHAFCNSAVELHAVVFCGWGKFIWVQKYLDKFTRVKYMKKFNKKNITFWLRRLVSHKVFGLEVPEGVRQNLDPWASDHTYPLMGAQRM